MERDPLLSAVQERGGSVSLSCRRAERQRAAPAFDIRAETYAQGDTENGFAGAEEQCGRFGGG